MFLLPASQRQRQDQGVLTNNISSYFYFLLLASLVDREVEQITFFFFFNNIFSFFFRLPAMVSFTVFFFVFPTPLISDNGIICLSCRSQSRNNKSCNPYFFDASQCHSLYTTSVSDISILDLAPIKSLHKKYCKPHTNMKITALYVFPALTFTK